MPDPLRQCINNFGIAPRRLSLCDRLTYLRVPKPPWVRTEPPDKLTVLFRHLRTLFREGTVLWGHIIQANRLMFENGEDDCPAEVVYSLEDTNKADPEYLRQIAHELYSLKGTKPRDPDLARIADHLTDEYTRVFGFPVPSIISPTLRCRMSTTFLVRKHLPDRRLCSSLLPIIVNPKRPYVALPLPERYWPEELMEWWSQ